MIYYVHVVGVPFTLDRILRAVATKKKLVRPKYEECEKKDDGKSCEARQAVCSTSLFQLGVWGRCKPPSGVRGRAPETFENVTLSYHKVEWFLLTLAWKVPRLHLDYFVLNPCFFFAQNWSGHGQRIGPCATALILLYHRTCFLPIFTFHANTKGEDLALHTDLIALFRQNLLGCHKLFNASRLVLENTRESTA